MLFQETLLQTSLNALSIMTPRVCQSLCLFASEKRADIFDDPGSYVFYVYDRVATLIQGPVAFEGRAGLQFGGEERGDGPSGQLGDERGDVDEDYVPGDANAPESLTACDFWRFYVPRSFTGRGLSCPCVHP